MSYSFGMQQVDTLKMCRLFSNDPTEGILTYCEELCIYHF